MCFVPGPLCRFRRRSSCYTRQGNLCHDSGSSYEACSAKVVPAGRQRRNIKVDLIWNDANSAFDTTLGNTARCINCFEGLID
jgi:hypothetical protein